jgi:triosephosphate isomerase
MGEVTVAEVAVCPPFAYLRDVQELLEGSAVAWGGQDVSIHESGAYTGEVAGSMLADFGCKYAIVGHSERRTYHKESNQLVAEKFEAALASGLVPIFCVGETLEQREQGVTEAVVGAQVDAVIERGGVEMLGKGVIAYEPVWAIGTGKTATPEQAQDVHAFIRGRVADKSGEVADRIRILYGGSMKPGNAAELISKPDIDGGLIGGAALKAEDFLAICTAAG